MNPWQPGLEKAINAHSENLEPLEKRSKAIDSITVVSFSFPQEYPIVFVVFVFYLISITNVGGKDHIELYDGYFVE